jgi:hypothetical protein
MRDRPGQGSRPSAPDFAGCRPCPAILDAPASEGSSNQKISKENDMRSILGIALGAFVFAAALLFFATAPGFWSDRDSTVPVPRLTREAGR